MVWISIKIQKKCLSNHSIKKLHPTQVTQSNPEKKNKMQVRKPKSQKKRKVRKIIQGKNWAILMIKHS
jgi:hypothetical protein